jgi:hypothetical protein
MILGLPLLWENLEKLRGTKNDMRKVGEFVWSGKIVLATRNFALTIKICFGNNNMRLLVYPLSCG